jgi:hypothetical protein
MTAAPALNCVISVHLKHGGAHLQTSRPNLLVDITKKNPFNFLCGSGWFSRIEKRGVGEEFVGSYLYQVHHRCLESNDYGRLLSGNNAYIKVKRLFADCPLYRSTSKLNGIFAQHRRSCNMNDIRLLRSFGE